jgi:cell division protein FtsQ
LGCYLAFAFVIVPLQKDCDSCKGIVINITDNKLGTISNEDIEEMLRDEELFPEGKQMDSIRCYEIENFINAMTLIKECQVYKTNEKRVKIDVICREPVLKVLDRNGETYYVDIEGEKINDIRKPLLLPVASGEIDDSMINNELRNVVSVIEKDPFWIAQIEQIYFNDKREAIITPRMGDQIIELGSIKKLDEKLSNLKTFYTKALNSVGWDKYSKLNIKISNKVICTKRDK